MLSFGAESRVSSVLSKNVKITIYVTIILTVVLYGCETWSLTLREESRLMLFENRVLRRIFEPKRDEVTGELRKLYNDELNDLYCSPNTNLAVDKKRADHHPVNSGGLHKDAC